MQKNISTDLWLSRIGLGLIFCYCLLASLFFSPFAHIHLTLQFLPFPIFIGEIVMFICLPLLVWVCKDGKSFDRRTILLLGLYFGWVLLKSLINYYYDGPLTCRNAALFYYPIFAVFAYYFYQKSKIPRKALMSLALLAAGILFFKVMVGYYWWTYVTLFAIAVWNTKSVKWRWLGWVFLAVIFLLGKEYLYQGSRSHFVSVFGAIVFLVSYFGTLLAKRRDYAVLSISLISFLFFIMGYSIFSARNDISSVTSLRGMINTYNVFDKQYQTKQGEYVPSKLSSHLYNPKKFASFFSPLPSITSQPKVSALVVTQLAEAERERELSAEIKRAGEKAAEIEKARAAEIEEAREQAAEAEKARPKLVVIVPVTKPAAPQPAAPQPAAPQPAAPQPAVTQAAVSQPKVTARAASQPKVTASLTPLTDWLKNIQCGREGRSLEADEGNIVFRFFVWRDMVRELIEQKAWWGFSFGHPQRSRSLEVLGWAKSEWARDGWITPHNSFFHIIYRAGILGVCLIGILFFMICRLIRDFFNLNSVVGGLLVGALIYWLVLSNFLVILEFPYNAIVFWSLFGITMAYRDGIKL